MKSATSRIQREIRQTRPFSSPESAALVALLRTTDQVRRVLARHIEPHGVTPQQYNVLRILRGAGESGLPTLEIAERMIEAAPGITRLMDRLEAKGLVRRVRCQKDRRQILCWITPAGLELVGALDAPVARADREALGALSPQRLARLVRLLDDVRAALTASPAAGPGDAHSSRPVRGASTRTSSRSQGDR